MDKVEVPQERDAPPAWAQPNKPVRTTPRDKPTASQPQLNYIQSLLTRKDLTPLPAEQAATLKSLLQEEGFWDERTTRLTKAKAGRILDRLTELNDRPKDAYEPTRDMAERFAMDIPAGRYAVTADSGELRFYQVWVSRDKKRLNLYVQHGPDQSDLKYQKTVLGILRKIKQDVRAAAIRYGLEIGECSNCGRRLTNRISRELGIGPVCGGRLFGETEWKDEVKAKRADLVAQGLDPDEELSDD